MVKTLTRLARQSATHELAARATDAYEKARDTVAKFMNASSSAEIVFARGTTEAINLVAQSWGRQHIKAGDEIVYGRPRRSP